jgi:hypothetical protein
MRARFICGRWTGALVALSAACGSSPHGLPLDPGIDAATGAGAVADAGRSADDAGTFVATGDDAASGSGCSGDLRSVVDSNGSPTKTCSAGQGCANGACVSACDAAAASHGYLGCDFLAVTPTQALLTQPCYVVFVTNGWSTSAHLQVSRGGQSLDVSRFARVPTVGTDATTWPLLGSSGLAPNAVAVLFLSHDPSSTNANVTTACPVPVAVDQPTDIANGVAVTSGRGQAFHITADVPVSAYDLMPFGGHSGIPGASLLLPTSAWGTNYVAAVPLRANVPLAENTPGPQFGIVLAASDGTTVKVVPTTDLPGGVGVASTARNTLGTYALAAGEFIEWRDSNEMSGTRIEADKPVAFVGGADVLNLADPSGTFLGAGDTAHQQIPPVQALGSEYVGAPYATRLASGQPEDVMYRIVNVVDGATLTFDPPMPNVATMLAAGQAVDFASTPAFRVSSQDAKHPFYLSQLMGGCPGNCDLGDEEWANVLPPAQFLSKYVFFTDPTYDTTDLVFVRVASPSGFKDVTLDCAGTISGWQPVGSGGTYEATHVDLIRAGHQNGACNNGPHVATSAGRFGLTVWGEISGASYAYPAGGNAALLNQVVAAAVPR